MSKKIIKPVLIVLVALFILNVAKNGLIQTVLGASISSAAHVPVHIGSTNASLFRGSIGLRGIRIDNPRGFPERKMLEINRIFIDLEPAALLKRQAHFETVQLDLKELIVIKNREGVLNVNALKPSPAEKDKQKAEKQRLKEAGEPKLRIDKLVLSIGRVVYKDYSQGGEPAIQEFKIDVKDRVYTNIQNPSGVISLIMVEALTRTTLSRLADLDMDVFKDGAQSALSQGFGLVGQGADTFESTAKGLASIFQ